METYTLLVTFVVVLFAVLIWREQARHRGTVRRQRRAMWDRCLALFEQPAIAQDDIDFPLLKGLYEGRRVTLEPIADHVGYRKLPQLWLRATVFAKLPVRGTFDYLARPENIEFYSSIWSLPVTVTVPPSWPQHALLRTDAAERMPPLTVLSRHMGMFDDPRLKELVVTPRGVRTVFQLDQGQRANYAVLRSVRFDGLQVSAESLEMLLGPILALISDLERADLKQTAAA